MSHRSDLTITHAMSKCLLYLRMANNAECRLSADDVIDIDKGAHPIPELTE